MLRNCSRLTISLTIRSAIACLWPSSSRLPKNADVSLSGMPETSKIVRACTPLPTLTWRASRRSRVPPHSGQGLELRYFASSSRTITESVSR